MESNDPPTKAVGDEAVRAIEEDFALALQLQGTYDKDDDDDDERKPAAASDPHQDAADHDEADRLLALKLQSEEQALYERAYLAESKMLNDPTGRAWKFVEQVHSLHQRLSNSSRPAQNMTSRHLIQPVAKDDMVYTAELLIEAQMAFRRTKRPTVIDIGYHYTRKANMKCIKTHGLLSGPEREAKNIKSKVSGKKYGEGIYTATSPLSHHGHGHRYGDVGILVARLKGKHGTPEDNQKDDSVQAPYQDIVVLKNSFQCLPLIHYDAKIIFPHHPEMNGNKLIKMYEVELQKLIAIFFPLAADDVL